MAEIVDAAEVGQLLVGLLSDGCVVVALCCSEAIRVGNRARVRDAARRRGDSICSICGWQPSLPARAACEHCANIQESYQDGARGRARQQGLCITCRTSPACKDGLMCKTCRTRVNEQQRARAKARRDRLRDAGLCTACGGARDCELLMCDECRDRVQIRMRSYREALSAK